MDIENTLTRGKHQLLLKKIRTKKKIKKLQKKLTVNPRPKQEPTLGSLDEKTLPKGQKNCNEFV